MEVSTLKIAQVCCSSFFCMAAMRSQTGALLSDGITSTRALAGSQTSPHSKIARTMFSRANEGALSCN
jgi:hypothetical protein